MLFYWMDGCHQTDRFWPVRCFKPHRAPKTATSISSMCSGSFAHRIHTINKPTCICPRIPARTPATAVSSKASLVAPATHFFHEPQTPKKAIPHCQSPTTNPSRLLRLLNFCVASGPPADTSTSPSRICSPPRREPHRKPTCVAPIPGLSKSVSRASCTFPPGRESPSPAHSPPQSDQDQEAERARGRGHLFARDSSVAFDFPPPRPGDRSMVPQPRPGTFSPNPAAQPIYTGTTHSPHPSHHAGALSAAASPSTSSPTGSSSLTKIAVAQVFLLLSTIKEDKDDPRKWESQIESLRKVCNVACLRCLCAALPCPALAPLSPSLLSSPAGQPRFVPSPSADSRPRASLAAR